jgi:hypothetical protein
MESYPEIDEVKYSESTGGRPITQTGLKPAERVYYLSYRGGKKVRGTLMFVENYKGEISYSQTLCGMNYKVPQDWIDATWPVMKKIENDLESLFGLPEIQNSVRVNFVDVNNPDGAVLD